MEWLCSGRLPSGSYLHPIKKGCGLPSFLFGTGKTDAAPEVSGLTPPRWLERRTSHGSTPALREGFPLTSWRDRRWRQATVDASPGEEGGRGWRRNGVIQQNDGPLGTPGPWRAALLSGKAFFSGAEPGCQANSRDSTCNAASPLADADEIRTRSRLAPANEVCPRVGA